MAEPCEVCGGATSELVPRHYHGNQRGHWYEEKRDQADAELYEALERFYAVQEAQAAMRAIPTVDRDPLTFEDEPDLANFYGSGLMGVDRYERDMGTP